MNLSPMDLEEIDARLAKLGEGVEPVTQLERGTLEEVDGWLATLSEGLALPPATSASGVDKEPAEANAKESATTEAAAKENAGDAENANVEDAEEASAESIEVAEEAVVDVPPETDEASESPLGATNTDDAVLDELAGNTSEASAGIDEAHTSSRSDSTANLHAALTPSDLAELAALDLPVEAPAAFSDEEEESTALFDADDAAPRDSFTPQASSGPSVSEPPPLPNDDSAEELEIDMDDLVEIEMDDLEIIDEVNEGPEDEGGEKKGFFKKIFG